MTDFRAWLAHSPSLIIGVSHVQKILSFSLVLSLLLLFSVLSCTERKTEITSVDENSLPIAAVLGERLPDYNTLYFSSGIGYEFKNPHSNKLIITLDGGPGFLDTRIDLPGDVLRGYEPYDYFLHLYDDYSIFVPEKFDWGRNREPRPLYDEKARERYTVDNLIINYAEVIGEYLTQNDYETVIIAGWSEGGSIAPELYFRLGDFNVSGLIIIGSGGIPLYENYQILHEKIVKGEAPFNSENSDIGMSMEFYEYIIRTYRIEYLFNFLGNELNDSPDIWGITTNRWWNSMLFRKPVEFYKEINIPVLFLHGELDTTVSVESSRYVEENLPDKPFTYRYYPEMWHWPRTYGEFMAMRRDISAWLEAEGL